MKWDRHAFPELCVNVFRYIVLTLMALFVSYLALLSLFGTNLNIAGENFFLSDSPYKTIVAYILLVAVFYGFGRMKKAPVKDRVLTLICPVLLGVTFVFLLLFADAFELAPFGDQLAISNAAAEARHYDFTYFMKGNYFDFWPFQSRIVVFLIGLWSIAGDWNYRAFSVLNAVSVIVIIVMTVKTFERTGLIRKTGHRIAITIGLILLWPLLFYVSYVYGNLIGLAAMMTACLFLADFLETDSVRSLIGMSVFSGIGLWLKNAYTILMVAMVVILIVNLIRSFRWRILVSVPVLIVCSLSFSSLSDAWLSNYTKIPVSEGSPMISWVTMAFGENEKGNPVRYDAYNIQAYLENDMDSGKASEAATKELKVRLDRLTDTPMHFLSFMAKKISLVWNEPTFDSLVFHNKGTVRANAPAWLKDAVREDNRNSLYRFANLFHGLVLLGVLTWIFLKGKEASVSHLLYGVTFIGGFLFELFWETQPQYALVYFLLLIPYAVMGYAAAAEYLAGKPSIRQIAIGWGVPLLVIVAVAVLPLPALNELIRLNADDEAYTQVRTEKDLAEEIFTGAVRDGFYRMKPVSDPSLGIAVDGEYHKDDDVNRQMQVLLAGEDVPYAGQVTVCHEGDHDLIRLMRTQCLLSLDRSPEEDGAMVSQAYDEAIWHIKPTDQTGYAVLYGENLALTAEGTSLTLAPYTEAENQLWLFEQR